MQRMHQNPNRGLFILDAKLHSFLLQLIQGHTNQFKPFKGKAKLGLNDVLKFISGNVNDTHRYNDALKFIPFKVNAILS